MVQLEIPDERPMGTHVAHDGSLWMAPAMLVALARGMEAEVRDGNPGHQEVDTSRAFMERMAADRHHVRHGRAPEVAIQGSCDGLDAAPGRGQIGVPLLIRLTRPDTLAVVT